MCSPNYCPQVAVVESKQIRFSLKLVTKLPNDPHTNEAGAKYRVSAEVPPY